jgi:murein DD-endopeptidase MepM/ murein hydrolase activator NlpD
VQRTPFQVRRRTLAKAVGLAMIFTPAAAMAVAAAAQTPRPAPVSRLLARIKAPEAAPAVVQKQLVWRGADVDGDGAADFANPTGQAPRTHDAFGCGDFGASRDGGVREHEGVDYAARAGQAALAPISGFVTKVGYAYSGDNSLKFVEITNPAIGYVARAFYVDPSVAVGQALRLGQPIGRVVSLQGHYPGITDHVHLEVLPPGGRRVNAAGLIVARWVPGRAATAKG